MNSNYTFWGQKCKLRASRELRKNPTRRWSCTKPPKQRGDEGGSLQLRISTHNHSKPPTFPATLNWPHKTLVGALTGAVSFSLLISSPSSIALDSASVHHRLLLILLPLTIVAKTMIQKRCLKLRRSSLPTKPLWRKLGTSSTTVFLTPLVVDGPPIFGR
ncbi:hypothetical protein CK203_018208 [Vitis vinifera]|uniref:Uncharacterized protein n=1 Tax=Vitis vinifera TaxID=29760 RepID=A0A438JPE8_VITVI|nr:hypothetical protein CK203_018208 [Vitis vinifera]